MQNRPYSTRSSVRALWLLLGAALPAFAASKDEACLVFDGMRFVQTQDGIEKQPTTTALASARQFTLAFWLRVDAIRKATVHEPIEPVVMRNAGSKALSVGVSSPQAGVARVSIGINLASATKPGYYLLYASHDLPLPAQGDGAAHHYAMVFDGTQDPPVFRTYFDRTLTQEATSCDGKNPIPSDAALFTVPVWLTAGLTNSDGCPVDGRIALDNVGFWRDFAASTADVRALVDRAKTPRTLAPDRAAFVLDGDCLAGPWAGTTDLARRFQPGPWQGAGTAKQGPALAYQPAVVIDEMAILASRRMFYVRFKDRVSGQVAMVNRPPKQGDLSAQVTLTVDGKAHKLKDFLAWPDDSREDWLLVYPLPFEVPDNAKVTVTAPEDWCRTSAGNAEALAGQPVRLADRFNGLLGPMDTKPKTMRLGTNIVEDQGIGPQIFADLMAAGYWTAPGIGEVKLENGNPVQGDANNEAFFQFSEIGYPAGDAGFWDYYFSCDHWTHPSPPVTNPLKLKAGLRRFKPKGTITLVWDGPHEARIRVEEKGDGSKPVKTTAKRWEEGPVVWGPGQKGNRRVYQYECFDEPGEFVTPRLTVVTKIGNTEHHAFDQDIPDPAKPPLLHPVTAKTLACFRALRPVHPMHAGGDNSVLWYDDYTPASEKTWWGYLWRPKLAVARIDPVDIGQVQRQNPIADAKRGYVAVKVTTAAPHGFRDYDQVALLNAAPADSPRRTFPATAPDDGGESSPMPLGTAPNIRVVSATEFIYFKRTGGYVPEGTCGTLTQGWSGDDVKHLCAQQMKRRTYSLEAFCGTGNALKADMWLNLAPLYFSADAAKDGESAKLFADLARRLEPGRKLILEIGNEPWNFGAMYRYSATQIAHLAHRLPGAGAQGTATVADGKVTAVTVIAKGAGYAGNVFVTFEGGGGQEAQGWARVENGGVAEVTVTQAGQGYTAAPTPVFHANPWGGAKSNDTKALYRCLCWFTEKMRRLAREAFVKAGRPAADVQVVYNTYPHDFWGDRPAILDFYQPKWQEDPDYIALADYWGLFYMYETPPGQERRMELMRSLNAEQNLDLLELSIRRPGLHATKWDAIVKARKESGQAWQIAAYEAGTENICHGWVPNGKAVVQSFDERQQYTAKIMAVRRHPRMRRLFWERMQRAQDAGCVLYVNFELNARDYMNSQGGGGRRLQDWWAYARYLSHGEMPGKGDGSDGLNDNRKNPWDEGVSVSTSGQALMEWDALLPKR